MKQRTEAPEDIVSDVLRRVYGDATQTALDHTAAKEILAALKVVGWASTGEVAMIVKAAGGRVDIGPALQMQDSDGWRIESWDDPMTLSRIIRVLP